MPSRTAGRPRRHRTRRRRAGGARWSASRPGAWRSPAGLAGRRGGSRGLRGANGGGGRRGRGALGGGRRRRRGCGAGGGGAFAATAVRSTTGLPRRTRKRSVSFLVETATVKRAVAALRTAGSSCRALPSELVTCTGLVKRPALRPATFFSLTVTSYRPATFSAFDHVQASAAALRPLPLDFPDLASATDGTRTTTRAATRRSDRRRRDGDTPCQSGALPHRTTPAGRGGQMSYP